MAVPAFASLVSLTNVLENIQLRIKLQYPPLEAEPFDTLNEGVNFLLNFLEANFQRKSKVLDGLWRQVSGVAYEVEDIIDLHVVRLLHEGSVNDERDIEYTNFNREMAKVNQKIDFIKAELSMAKEGEDDIQGRNQPRRFVLDHALPSPSRGENIVVGFDKHLMSVLDELTKDDPKLQIVSITGMGGIGKTTLAKHVYNHEHIGYHFDIRMWVSISQDYTVMEILQTLLSDRENKETCDDLCKLGEKLHKRLFGRRYLIVMDDIWSTTAWDDFKMFFPNDMIKSRIIVTTRNLNVAYSLSLSNPCEINLLDDESSWNLLCLRAFSQEGCPRRELEEISKDIAKGCNGLPLAIVVIGSLLSNSEMTQECWEDIAKDIKGYRHLRDGDRCLEILCLSYNNLPIYLRPCFLYMRNFREDEQIHATELIKLWIAEGFVESVKDSSLECLAEDYLESLARRNLIVARLRDYRGKIFTCAIHDLVRDLCLREYRKEQFVCSPKVQRVSRTWEPKPCFLCNQPCGELGKTNLPKLVLISPSTSRANPFMCDTCTVMYSHVRRLKLVKVMNINVQEYSPQELVHATKARYIHLKFFHNLRCAHPSLAPLLWSLQTLIIDKHDVIVNPVVLPSEIWEMPQLRHIEVKRALLTYPTKSYTEGQTIVTLEHLLTLSSIENFMCTWEVAYRIPNLKKLQICDLDWLPGNSLCNLVNLHKLETLIIDKRVCSRESIYFPSSLKWLCMRNTGIPWEDMTIVGSLPNLETFVLDDNNLETEWNPIEGQFLQLKELIITATKFCCWRVESIHFPKLEMLALHRVVHLEIPSAIGDIQTLTLISLYDCSGHVVNSAKRILEEQQNMGNEVLEIFVSDKHRGQYRVGAEI